MVRQGARPFTPILVSILRFLFMGNRHVQSSTVAPAESSGAEFVSSGESYWWTALLERIFGWGIGSLVVLIALIFTGVSVWYVARWLFSRTSVSGQRPYRKGRLGRWIVKLRTFLLLCWEWLSRRMQSSGNARQLYKSLLAWGRHSGLPCMQVETPLEYGKRLIRDFPAVKQEIELIIDVFQQEVYGELVLHPQQFTRAHLALRRLHNPVHWPSRLRMWLLVS